MSDYSKTNQENHIKFRNATNLYEVEPIVQFCASWLRIEDVLDLNKAIPLCFSEVKGKELYAKYVRVEERVYWETYIKDHSNISILYLPTFALNPVGQKVT